jgi:hypothetical protein
MIKRYRELTARFHWDWRVFRGVFWCTLLLGVILIGLPGPRMDTSSGAYQTLTTARDFLFDFAAWEFFALEDKVGTAVLGPQRYMDDAERVDFVRNYFDLINEIRGLEREIEALYIDPAEDNPDAASADLRARREVLREEQQGKQGLAEAIIQSQVAEMLVEYGFGAGGTIAPPVFARFTELPTILIVSPRDRIERIGAYPLEHGLTADQQTAIEFEVDTEQDVSSLIVPLGGLAVWPAMIIETGNLPFAYEVIAHEWAHHYLAFYPLGFNYGTTPELYTMNETAASIVGKEIGWAVLDRYYPDLAPAPPDYTPQPPAEPGPPPEASQPPAFDFRVEMHETRVRVDELLAAGQVEEAEAYMEARRIFFYEQGYTIRKINQAYFAFYGSYADQPGATGSDPVGPAIRDLRFYSKDLRDFVTRLRGFTTFEEVQAELEEASRNGE